jgi:tRNA pseudouridine55 synthase
VGGERAYDLAREGEQVILEPRPVEVFEARLLAVEKDWAEFEILCGKGTYVRSWVRDIAQALGTFGHVSALRRTRLGSWDEKGAVGLDTLTPFMHSPAAFGYLRPLATALDGIPALAVSGPDTVRIRSGNPILIRSGLFAKMKDGFGEGELHGQTVFLKDADGSPVALAEIAEGELRPFRVFNFST